MQLAFDLGWPDEAARLAGRRLVRSRSGFAEQPSLPGLEQERLDNLFLGLRPDGETTDRIRRRVLPELYDRRGLVVSPLRLPLLHVSLVGLGGYDGVPRGRVAAVGEAFRHLAQPGFEVAFDTVTWFRQSDAVVLTGGDGLDALRDLRRALLAALARGGLKAPAPAGFTPHMTLRYSRQPFAACPVSPVRWRAREVALIDSMVGQARHAILALWPLGN